MTQAPAVNARHAVLAVGVAAASALAMSLVLAAASSPPDFRTRLAALETQAQQTSELMRPLPTGSLYPADALCGRDTAAAARKLHDSLSAAAAQANLTLDSLDVRPDFDPSGPAALKPLRVRFSATGPYENVVMLLSTLSRQRPDLFADGVDLTAKTSNVALSFSGRAFCSA
jgi:Type II secretion system (T2SS), protein M subtype b